MRTLSLRCVSVAGAILSFASAINGVEAADSQPAMIGSGSESVAAKLHYPAKERDRKQEAAVTFYCEVDTEGKAHTIRPYSNKGDENFRLAVEKALKQGRFTPARVGGRPTPVMIGATVFFLNKSGPVIAVALATAEKEKAAGFQNYIQPQMISSSAEFRRKMYKERFGIIFKSSPRAANARVVVDVDAQGNMTNKTLVEEYPAKGGYGELVMKGLNGAKFIPATSNGKPTAGKFGFATDFTRVFDPDAEPGTGSHVRPKDE
jgi:hypothetical protein